MIAIEIKSPVIPLLHDVTYMPATTQIMERYNYAIEKLNLPTYLAEDYAYGEELKDLKIPQTQINAEIVEAVWSSGILPPKPAIPGVPVVVGKSRCDKLRSVASSILNKHSNEGGTSLNLVSDSTQKNIMANYGADLYKTLARYDINCVDPYMPNIPIKGAVRDVARKILIEAGILPQYNTLSNLDIPEDIYEYTIYAVASEAKLRWYNYDPDLKAVKDPSSDEEWVNTTRYEFDQLKLRSKKVNRITIDQIFQIVGDNAVKNIPIIERYYAQVPKGKFATWVILIGTTNMTALHYFTMQTYNNAIVQIEKITNLKLNAAGKELILDMVNYIVDYWNLKSL